MSENTLNSFLSFKLHNEFFAVSINKVLEVLLEYKLVELPEAPRYIEGMLSFRGDIIPVINFKEKFNFPKSEDSENVIIVMEIILDNNNIKFGAVVDRVKDVFPVSKTELKPIPEFGSKYNPEYLSGVVHKDNNFYMLLDIEKVFSDKEIDMISEL